MEGTVEYRSNMVVITPARDELVETFDAPTPSVWEEQREKLVEVADGSHEHEFTQLGRINGAPGKLFLVRTCPQHPDKYQAFEYGDYDAMEKLYVFIKGDEK